MNVEVKITQILEIVTELKGDVTELKGDVAELKGDVTALKGNFATLERAVVEINEQKLPSMLHLIATERTINNARHLQTMSALKGLDERIVEVKVQLNEKIDHVYHSLSEDICAIALDGEKVKRRVSALEHKMG